ncbi:hypothetical protein [Dyadobacter sp. NIV53]|uniref:hypothetical protein n=1 Tax=Dyadobacter sp. NIV53 TaxID=2861765 RepID=UPI001C86ED08|nr:hypothetical protein [Dyadobacter sp. NIV53]
MIAFYLILISAYLFYSRSKYFPQNLPKTSETVATWIATVLLVTGTALFVRSDDWAGGLIIALAACSLAMTLVQLFAVVGRIYFYGFTAIIHGLLFIELLSYAS